MNDRNTAFRVARRKNTAQAWRNARALCNRIAKSLRIAKRKYVSDHLYQVRGDGLKFWRIINSTFFGNTAPPINEILDQSNGAVLQGLAASNEVNKFFVEVSVSLAEKFVGKPMYRIEVEHKCDIVPQISIRKLT